MEVQPLTQPRLLGVRKPVRRAKSRRRAFTSPSPGAPAPICTQPPSSHLSFPPRLPISYLDVDGVGGGGDDEEEGEGGKGGHALALGALGTNGTRRGALSGFAIGEWAEVKGLSAHAPMLARQLGARRGLKGL